MRQYLEQYEKNVLQGSIEESLEQVTKKYAQSTQPIYQVLGEDGDE